MTEAKRAAALAEWHLGSMNDGLFIIDTPPRPSTDEVYHDRKDGPTLVLNVTDLPHEKAKAIVDAHNRALRRFAETEDRPAGDLREVVAKAIMAVGPNPTFLEMEDATFSAISAAGYDIVKRGHWIAHQPDQPGTYMINAVLAAKEPAP